MGTERMGGDGAVLAVELRRAEEAGRSARAVVLVEGASDQRAIAALARRKGRDLATEGIEVIAAAGATNFRRFLEILGPGRHALALAGLCDEGEQADLRRALAGVGLDPEAGDLGKLGFFVCVRDLEDELVRALGAAAMLELMESQGDLRRFRSFQKQPAQTHKTVEQQLWRWLGNHKIRYAPLMVEAVEMSRMPRPLEGVLARV